MQLNLMRIRPMWRLKSFTRSFGLCCDTQMTVCALYFMPPIRATSGCGGIAGSCVSYQMLVTCGCARWMETSRDRVRVM